MLVDKIRVNIAEDGSKDNPSIACSGFWGLIRAVSQAYRQALVNASKTGAAQKAMQNTVHRASKSITDQEARQILGVPENAAWEQILNKYDILFERNAKQGSFYLQSKVHRAKEYLEGVYRNKGQGNTI